MELVGSLARGSTSCVPRLRNLYELRPKVSASSVLVASRVVNPAHDELRPAVSKEVYQFRPTVCASCLLVASQFVNRTRMSCIAR
jgi:hypothetical protein